ncbi:hypothetical protein GCM10023160_01050 [Brachybacterium paraconglomeratum]|uniref:hypothetical protein n=1 Tax=Brachybacterium paraconglomeratum TaxID=173362 RepID=UPI0031EAD7F1
MSNAGWGGPGNGPQDEAWQDGAPQAGAPSAGAPQGGQPQPGGGQHPGGQPHPGGGQPASPYGAPSTAPWQSPPAVPQSPGQPHGPGGPQGPGHPQGPNGPGHFGPQPPRKRPWALIAVALGCVLAMMVVVGGGITYLVLSRTGDDSTIATDTPADPSASGEAESPTPAEASTPFEVVVPYDPPTGTVDELWQVMSDNPLTEGTLPTLGTCDLPATPVEPSVEELQAVLDAASTCLNQLWSTTSSDRELPWLSPKIVVYTHPDVPAEAVCDSQFSADAPRMCNLDATIYWPVGYGTASDLTDPADVPAAYLWDLAFTYTNTASWNSSLTVYYVTMRNELETTDPERFDEAWRRFTLQRLCLASAASMQFPTDVEPAPALRDMLTDPGNWSEGEPPESVSPESQALWIERGFSSQGDLSVCNAWVADLEQVT